MFCQLVYIVKLRSWLHCINSRGRLGEAAGAKIHGIWGWGRENFRMHSDHYSFTKPRRETQQVVQARMSKPKEGGLTEDRGVLTDRKG